MATAADVRKCALALDGVDEVDHWGRSAFRTKKRIFAVMRPDGLYLHLTEERKQFLFEAAPEVFVRFMWGKTANVIVRIAEVSAMIAAAVEQQSAATREIARNVQMASSGAAQVGGAIADVHQGAADTGSASGQVLSSAQSLSGQASQLKLEVDNFLASIRAA